MIVLSSFRLPVPYVILFTISYCSPVVPPLSVISVVVVVLLLASFNITIDTISNPFDGIFRLDTYKVSINNRDIGVVAIILTTVWVVWVLNLLSWSNGIDGQYSGIIGIVGLVISILALRFTPLEPIHGNYAKLAIIISGASLGLTKYT